MSPPVDTPPPQPPTPLPGGGDLPASATHSGSGNHSASLGRLLIVLVVLLLVWVGPSWVARFQYQYARATLQAEADVAAEALPQVATKLSDLVLASRLVAKRVSPSVVSVDSAGLGGRGGGSGVIIDADGYVLTNYHVVDNAVGLEVRLADGRTASAGVVGGDPKIDLAVLKISLPDLVPVEWGDSSKLEVGDLVWALGSPFGLERSVTFGIVSAKHRRSESWVARNSYQEYLQTDAAVNPGNSGGPLVDLEGRLIGINTAIVGRSYQGISFAIPSQLVKSTYEKLRQDGWIERGYLGISPQPVPEELRQQLQLEENVGVLAATVAPRTPAERAGLQPGDVVLQWGDHTATEPFLLVQAIADTPVGTNLEIRIKRLVRGEPVELTVPVTVGSVPRM